MAAPKPEALSQPEALYETPFSAMTLDAARHSMAVFANERGWERFHSPRNLCLALVGEVGEVCELFQWRGECEHLLPGWSQADRVHLGEELSDCLFYLVRLADRCGIDLPKAAEDKMAKNRAKYPADRAFGRSDKYTAYAAAEAGSSAGGGGGGGGGASTPAPKQAPALSPKGASPTDPSTQQRGGALLQEFQGSGSAGWGGGLAGGAAASVLALAAAALGFALGQALARRQR